ncbi:MAG: hypothetical protein KAS19_06130 [Anaerolineales bacterium]|nr:hypothetical protein [Anaerolineales bacterium]
MYRTQAQPPPGFAREAVPVDDKWLGIAHPLAASEGATNAFIYSTDLLGDVTLVNPGAGCLATGYAILSDYLARHRNAKRNA